jgi:type IV fimbrial biogenesis protein FimT
MVRQLPVRPTRQYSKLEFGGGTTVLKHHKKVPRTKGHERGFSLVELAIAMAIILVISAVAMPSITRTLRTYQLNDATQQLAGILKFTRYEAIRRNLQVSCLNAQGGANAPANVWSDDNGDNVEQPTERQIILSGNYTLVPSGAAPGGLAGAVGAPALTAVNPGAGNVTFDQRGAVVPGATIYVFYVGSTTMPENGYRAVIILPSGSVQVWSFPGGAGGGTWHQVS